MKKEERLRKGNKIKEKRQRLNNRRDILELLTARWPAASPGNELVCLQLLENVLLVATGTYL